MNVALRSNRAVGRRTRSLALCLAVWALAGAGEARAAGDAPPDPKLDPALRQALAQGTDATTIRVIVAHHHRQHCAGAGAHPVERQQRRRRARVHQRVDRQAPGEGDPRSRGAPVRRSHLARRGRAVERRAAAAQVGARRRAAAVDARAAEPAQGMGAGVGVAVLDSGVQRTAGSLTPAGSVRFHGGGPSRRRRGRLRPRNPCRRPDRGIQRPRRRDDRHRPVRSALQHEGAGRERPGAAPAPSCRRSSS